MKLSLLEKPKEDMFLLPQIRHLQDTMVILILIPFLPVSIPLIARYITVMALLTY